ncbi:MAG: DUF362 domain-containing protein [Candidatus Thorarchaeota archaeon]
MDKYKVAIGKYRKKLKSLRRVVELSEIFKGITGNEKVFIKPNIVYWSPVPDYPKYGVVTTSRIIEDTIILLKELGVDDITIGEGIVTSDPKDFEVAHDAFETLGYNRFKERYGIKVINVFERPFEKVDLGDDIVLNFNADALHSDLIISLPVLKTHSQAKVSLSLKNLKGLIDISSRKKCHTPDSENDLNFYLYHLPKKLPPVIAIVDGIYTNERGPGYDGSMRRSNILVASSDMLSVDKVGAKILGYDPADVSYLHYYAQENNRPIDFSDIELVGKSIDSVQELHKYQFEYTEDGSRPIAFDKHGIKGITYRQYDNTTCTYCSIITGLIPIAITYAWEGDPWDNVEVIMGKRMSPTPGKKKTILLGQCMVNKHRNNPDINEMIPLKGCPIKHENIAVAFHQAGINMNPDFFPNLDNAPRFFGLAYKHRFNEFQESFFNDAVEDETVPPIDNIIISQFYMDTSKGSSSLPEKQARFEIRFFGLAGEKNVNAIEKITVEGPKGYQFQFKNQLFNFENGNGYIIDNYNRQMIYYQAYDRNGFIEDGKYKIIVDYWNGESREKSRILQSNNQLLKSYLEIKDKLKFTFEEKPKYMGDPRIFVQPKWTTLNTLGGFDAYYALYVSKGRSDYINYHDLTHFDDIYTNSILMPSYGLNKSSALVNTRWRPLKSNSEYTWLTEISDSNMYENINMTIYQPIQTFKTK